jgi:hypothetical protein
VQKTHMVLSCTASGHDGCMNEYYRDWKGGGERVRKYWKDWCGESGLAGQMEETVCLGM